MLYDAAFVYFNDDLLAENTKLDLELAGDDQEIMTNALGFAGISPSPKVRRCTATNVVPITGIEKKFEEAYLNSSQVTMLFVLGANGAKCESKGYIKRVSMSSGVGSQTELSFEFVGTPSAFA
jgi:hypothetical protein